MAHYIIAQIKHNRDIDHILNTHHAMIGAPLIVILIFCFGFIAAHPESSNKIHASAASEQPDATAPDKSEIKIALPAAAKLKPVTVYVSENVSDVNSANAPQTSSSSHGNSNPQSGASQSQQKNQYGIHLFNNVKGLFFR